MPLFGLSVSAIEKMRAKDDVKGLVKALTYKGSSDIRQRAAKALGKLRSVYAIDDLASSLSNDDDENVKRCALEALIMIGTRNAVEVIENRLQKVSSILGNIIEESEEEMEWLKVHKSLKGTDKGQTILDFIDIFLGGGQGMGRTDYKRLTQLPFEDPVQEIVRLASIKREAIEAFEFRKRALSFVENFAQKIDLEQYRLNSVLLIALNEDNPLHNEAYQVLCKFNTDTLKSLNRALLNSDLKNNGTIELLIQTLKTSQHWSDSSCQRAVAVLREIIGQRQPDNVSDEIECLLKSGKAKEIATVINPEVASTVCTLNSIYIVNCLFNSSSETFAYFLR